MSETSETQVELLFTHGHEEPLEVIWPDSDLEKALDAWGYSPYFYPVGEYLAGVNSNGEADEHAYTSPELSVRTYRRIESDATVPAPAQFCVVIGTALFTPF